MWIARDKDGSLWLFIKKPNRIEVKNLAMWGFEHNTCDYIIGCMPMGMFPELKWENDPVEVDLIIKN